MNKFLVTIITIALIFVGCSLILFVFNMMWLSPNPMGIMMGKAMIMKHITLWLRYTFLIVIIFVIILVLLLLVYKNKSGRK